MQEPLSNHVKSSLSRSIRERVVASGISQDNPLADTSRIALPKAPDVGASKDVARTTEVASSEGSTAQFKSTLAALNAKITCGKVATLATLGAILYAGVPPLLEHVPVGLLKFLVGFKATEIVSSLWGQRRFLDDLINGQVAPDLKEKVERVRSILQPLCTAHAIREPHIHIDSVDQKPACLLQSLWGHQILALSPQTLEKLNDEELKALVAHEITHIGPKYFWFQTVTSSISSIAKSTLFFGATGLAFDALSPQFGTLAAFPLACGIAAAKLGIADMSLALAYSFANRHNELKSDLEAVQSTGDPEALISAIDKLQGNLEQTEQYRNLARLHLLSHPTLEDRAKSVRSVFGSSDPKELGNVCSANQAAE